VVLRRRLGHRSTLVTASTTTAGGALAVGANKTITSSRVGQPTR